MEPEAPPEPLISTAGWTLEGILAHSDNFHKVQRLTVATADKGISYFERKNIPVIIEGWHEHKDWPKDMFTLDFFQQHSPKDIHVRNVHDLKDGQIELDQFIAVSRNAPPCAPPGETLRMYGKDAECPQEWNQWIKNAGVIPESVHWNGPNDYFRYRPKNAPVETLMCYLGVGDTFTPAHKDLCASSGHNLMCYTENGGSSFWFMTESSDAPAASDFFHELGQELDHETHIISLDELAQAPFKIYVAEQFIGDLVLVPPRSCHQVVNFGGITLKTSWSRMTLDGLVAAYYHELPIYQRVCRPETYRVKSTIFCATRKQTMELKQLRPSYDAGPKTRQFKGQPTSEIAAMLVSLNTLVNVFREIVAQDYSGKDWPYISSTVGELSDEQTMEHRIVCDFCNGDIFQAFFECSGCHWRYTRNTEETPFSYTLCPGCYVDGRRCACLEAEPKQCFPRKELKRVVEEATAVIQEYEADWQPNKLISKCSTFKSACALRKFRYRKQVCVVDKEESHGLHCRLCHGSRCFRHLLVNSKLHAVEAISEYTANKVEHTKYHELHKESKAKYLSSAQSILNSQKLGIEGPIEQLRAHYTLKYPKCIPSVPHRSQLGFYDDSTGFIEGPDVEDEPPLFDVGSMSTLTPVPSNVSLPKANQSKAKQHEKSVKTARRYFMSYVAVPEAAYPIRRESPPLAISASVNPSPSARRDENATDHVQPGTTHAPSASTRVKPSAKKRKRQPSTSSSTTPARAETNVNAQISSSTLKAEKSSKVQKESRLFTPPPSIVSPSRSRMSLPSNRFRFPSGLVVTKLSTGPSFDGPIPDPLSTPPIASSASDAEDPLNIPLPDPSTRTSKRKRGEEVGKSSGMGERKGGGLSLAEAMNQASARNAQTSSANIRAGDSTSKLSTKRGGPNRGEPLTSTQSNRTGQAKAIGTIRKLMISEAAALATNPVIREHLIVNQARRAPHDQPIEQPSNRGQHSSPTETKNAEAGPSRHATALSEKISKDRRKDLDQSASSSKRAVISTPDSSPLSKRKADIQPAKTRSSKPSTTTRPKMSRGRPQVDAKQRSPANATATTTNSTTVPQMTMKDKVQYELKRLRQAQSTSDPSREGKQQMSTDPGSSLSQNHAMEEVESARSQTVEPPLETASSRVGETSSREITLPP